MSYIPHILPESRFLVHERSNGLHVGTPGGGWHFAPSTEWKHGGPIIEREGISVEFEPSADGKEQWLAQTCVRDAQFANTPLIAAMRCYVASKFGT